MPPLWLSLDIAKPPELRAIQKLQEVATSSAVIIMYHKIMCINTI